VELVWTRDLFGERDQAILIVEKERRVPEDHTIVLKTGCGRGVISVPEAQGSLQELARRVFLDDLAGADPAACLEHGQSVTDFPELPTE
jgi:hypothetical protein